MGLWITFSWLNKAMTVFVPLALRHLQETFTNPSSGKQVLFPGLEKLVKWKAFKGKSARVVVIVRVAERVKDRASSYWKPSSHALIVYLCDTVVAEFRRKFNASLSAPFVVLIAPVTQNEFVATHIRLPTMPASVLSTVPPTSTLQFPPVPSSVSRAPMTSVSLTKSTLLGQKNKDIQLMCVIFVLKLGKGPSGKPYSARYIRTLVIDFSQDFVVRWRKRIIWSPDSTNIQLAKIHPKVALYIGRKEEMEKLDDVFERFMSFSFVDSKIG
ncbi:hypothetical protein F2Q68_00025085 [Brassica cretica]|uniref:Uncharacterized protein n=1 Tax=Brassica cretica TaxID=69181 RepID=A0A8S9IFY1_BRACR|nr:hypothetical protein F2Q68_00025085 [Brassica cretica]